MATWRRRSVGGTTYAHLYMDVTLPSSGTYRCVYAIHMYSVRMYSLYVPIHRVCIGMYRLYIPITCYTRQNRLGLHELPDKIESRCARGAVDHKAQTTAIRVPRT